MGSSIDRPPLRGNPVKHTRSLLVGLVLSGDAQIGVGAPEATVCKAASVHSSEK